MRKGKLLYTKLPLLILQRLSHRSHGDDTSSHGHPEPPGTPRQSPKASLPCQLWAHSSIGLPDVSLSVFNGHSTLIWAALNFLTPNCASDSQNVFPNGSSGPSVHASIKIPPWPKPETPLRAWLPVLLSLHYCDKLPVRLQWYPCLSTNQLFGSTGIP